MCVHCVVCVCVLVELRDKGPPSGVGFFLAADQISNHTHPRTNSYLTHSFFVFSCLCVCAEPTGAEIWPAVQVHMDAVKGVTSFRSIGSSVTHTHSQTIAHANEQTHTRIHTRTRRDGAAAEHEQPQHREHAHTHQQPKADENLSLQHEHGKAKLQSHAHQHERHQQHA